MLPKLNMFKYKFNMKMIGKMWTEIIDELQKHKSSYIIRTMRWIPPDKRVVER